MARRAVLLFAFALAACGASARTSSVCTPRASLHCLTPVVCEIDRVAGCEVCRCSDAPYTPVAR